MKIDPATLSPDAAYHWLIASVAPRPIAWVSTLNEDGTANLAPFSYFTGAASVPPMVVICISRRAAAPKDTWRNIARTGEYVIHVVTDALAEQMNLTSGPYTYGTDEIALAGLSRLPSERVAPPRVAESPVAMECRLERIVEVGREPVALVIGEILLWHVDEALVDARGRLDPARLDVVGRLGGSAYARTRDQFRMQRPK